MLRPWDLRIVLDKAAVRPAYMQIVHALIDAIKSGRLEPGQALPGTRELAGRVGVNRKTIQQAYDELAAEGWLTAELKRGTFVSTALPQGGAPAPACGGRAAAGFAVSRPAPALGWTPHPPGTLVFDDGAPDTRLMPAALVARTWRQALLEAARRNQLGYGDPRGLPLLRRAVADMLNADRGLNVTEENICLTRGSQMGIWLAARLLTVPDEAVAFERLSYPPAREAFAANGAEIVSVALDEQGLIPEALEELCRARRIRAVYVTPHHQFPTTVTLPPSGASACSRWPSSMASSSSRTITTTNSTSRTAPCCRWPAPRTGDNCCILARSPSCSRHLCASAISWGRRKSSLEQGRR